MPANSKNKLNTQGKPTYDTMNWPEHDTSKLLKLIEDHIPKDDRLSFQARANKLPWSEISFDNYTGEDCQQMWEIISHRLRRYRLLRELVDDAKVWLSRPWTNFYGRKASNSHPDKPRKPLNVMQLYVKEHQIILKEQYPNKTVKEIFAMSVEMYKALSVEEKNEYLKRVRLLKEDYLINLKTFLKQHPDEATAAESKLLKSDIVKDSAFKLYLDEQIISKSKYSGRPLQELVSKFTKKWSKLSEEEKMLWLDRVHDSKPNKNVKKSKKEPKTNNSINIYNYFVRKKMLLEEIQNLPAKDRMKAISIQWKNLSIEEKISITAEHSEAMKALGVEVPVNGTKAKKRKTDNEPAVPEKIRKKNKLPNIKSEIKTGDIEAISEPETPRKSDNEPPVPEKIRKKNNPSNIKTEIKTKDKEAISEPETPKKSELAQEILAREPKPPPEEPIALFKKDMRKKKIKYSNSEELSNAWEELPKHEKKSFKKKLKNLKIAYLEEFETFISTLSKKELKAYNKIKQQALNESL